MSAETPVTETVVTTFVTCWSDGGWRVVEETRRSADGSLIGRRIQVEQRTGADSWATRPMGAVDVTKALVATIHSAFDQLAAVERREAEYKAKLEAAVAAVAAAAKGAEPEPPTTPSETPP